VEKSVGGRIIKLEEIGDRFIVPVWKPIDSEGLEDKQEGDMSGGKSVQEIETEINRRQELSETKESLVEAQDGPVLDELNGEVFGECQAAGGSGKKIATKSLNLF